MRGATCICIPVFFSLLFLLTHPLRGATNEKRKEIKKEKFLLTHPLRGATIDLWDVLKKEHISTHTPLAGCNGNAAHDNNMKMHFYSHTPCGVQPLWHQTACQCRRFLLTHPLRGATYNPELRRKIKNISTHTPLAGCNITSVEQITESSDFYSHTPCGVQLHRHSQSHSQIQFLLTHPLRGATIWSTGTAVI